MEDQGRFIDKLEAAARPDDDPQEAPEEEIPEAVEPAPEPEQEEPEVPAAPESREDSIMDAAKEIDSAVAKLTGGTPDPAPAPAAQEERKSDTKIFPSKIHYDDEDEPTSPRPKFNFDDLQFGSKYDTGRIK
jgi:hypothetical protein